MYALSSYIHRDGVNIIVYSIGETNEGTMIPWFQCVFRMLKHMILNFGSFEKGFEREKEQNQTTSTTVWDFLLFFWGY